MNKAQQLLKVCEISTDDIHSRIDYEHQELAPLRKQANDLFDQMKALDRASFDATDPEKKKTLQDQADKIRDQRDKISDQIKSKQAKLQAEWKTILKRRRPKVGIVTLGGTYTKSGKRIR